MRRTSLGLRLVLAASLLVALALALAGVGLTLIFDRVLEARSIEDLDRSAKLIAGRVGLSADGAPTLTRELPDPRFAAPYGGLYWQIEASGRGVLRSRSLWDQRLAVPAGTDGVTDMAGPDGGSLIALTRIVEIGASDHAAGSRLSITVAEDRHALTESRTTFLRALVPSLAALFAVLSLAMTVFVRRALAPFRALRTDLARVHAGTALRLPEAFPEEVHPLVADLNQLLDAQERALARAQTGAADMAHGLKTPLAILDALARRLVPTAPAAAAEIAEQGQAMNGQVERALARARVAVGPDLRRRACLVAPVVERLVATMQRLPDGGSLAWDIVVPVNLAYPGGEGELMEAMGNLLDNARKWAHRGVWVTGASGASAGCLAVEDDGPGMDAEAIAGLGRGVRWDESRPGTGFGLAIVRDVVETAGGQVEFGRSTMGGLRVEIVWPAVVPG